MSAKDAFALKCPRCDWRPDGSLPVGVVAAHMETEHNADDVALEMIVVCDRCDRQMTHLATVGEQHHYECQPCHRGRVIRQRSR